MSAGVGSATVVVAGGGIGGLAAAIAIAGAGHRVLVCERGGEFEELGAGIQLAPNGMYALARLGLADEVTRIAVPVEELRMMDGLTGQPVVSLPLDEDYRAQFGNPYVVIHRGELYRLLLRACRDNDLIELRAATPVRGYQQIRGGVAVLLETGQPVVADALLGADGLHSAVRAQLLGAAEPRNAGITVYRSIVPMDRVPAHLRTQAVTWWVGPGRHLVHYPIAGGRYLNLAPSVANNPAGRHAGAPTAAEEVRGQFSMLCEPARQLLDLGADWRSWVLVDRPPVDEWTSGTVALLGDAAHPMLHYAAQGACLALEDAVVLGDLLDCGVSQFAARLRRYNAKRRSRTARVHRLARESIQLWHAEGAAAAARNAMLSAMSATELRRYLGWLHGARAGATPVGESEPTGTYTLGGFLELADDDPPAPRRAEPTYTLSGVLDPPGGAGDGGAAPATRKGVAG